VGAIGLEPMTLCL